MNKLLTSRAAGFIPGPLPRHSVHRERGLHILAQETLPIVRGISGCCS